MTQQPTTSILLADDNPTFLMYAGILIKRLGYKSYLARDGVEAINFIKEKKPSIIVLNYMMPKMTGISCLSMIKADPELKYIPVIVISDYDSPSAKDECEKLGCRIFLKKPLNVPDFYVSIQKCLEHDIKRRFIRAPLSVRVNISDGDRERELYTSNLSTEGMFIRTISPYAIGTSVNLVFSVDDDDPVELKGEVVSAKQLFTEIEPEPGMGIKFFDVPEDVRYRIFYFIMKEMLKDLSVEGRFFTTETLQE